MYFGLILDPFEKCEAFYLNGFDRSPPMEPFTLNAFGFHPLFKQHPGFRRISGSIWANLSYLDYLSLSGPTWANLALDMPIWEYLAEISILRPILAYLQVLVGNSHPLRIAIHSE